MLAVLTLEHLADLQRKRLVKPKECDAYNTALLQGRGWCCVCDGHIVAFGGVVVANCVGEAWLVLLANAQSHKIAVVRATIEAVKRLHEMELQRVQARVDVQDKQSVRFAQAMGFTAECLMRKALPGWRDAVLLARVYG